MKELNLQTIIVLILGAIVAVFGFTRGGGDEVLFEPLEIAASPSEVHPPADVQIQVTSGYPDGTVFELRNGDDKIGDMEDGVAVLHMYEWSDELRVVGRAPNGRIRSAAVTLELRNKPPLFHSLFIDQQPEVHEWVGFSLYYRLHGCNASGQPSLVTGVQDPDYAREESANTDRTDSWQYQVEVERIDTGIYEPVWVCVNGQVRALGEEWVRDPRFVWVPYYRDLSSPSGLICASFPPHDSSNDDVEYGFVILPGESRPFSSRTAPMHCTKPQPEPFEPGEPTHKIHVWVREFGRVYHEVYRVSAVDGGCE